MIECSGLPSKACGMALFTGSRELAGDMVGIGGGIVVRLVTGYTLGGS